MTCTSCPRPMDGPRQLFKGTLAANVLPVAEGQGGVGHRRAKRAVK